MKNNNLLSVAFASLLLFSQVLAWDNSCSNCNTNQRLRVATWSANQTPGYTTNNAERLQGSLSFLAGSSVAALNLNLVCLQEVYNTSDRQAIINGLSGAFPYNFGAAAGTQGSCDPSNTNCNLFGGNSGTLILSTLPIEASQVLTFQTQAQTNSNALWVKVTWNGVPVNFVCTDLLPDDYSASGVNYEALNMAQTQELLGWLNTNVPNNQPVILTGDFGSGPAVGSNSGVFVNNYNLITGAGYQNAFLQLVPAADVPSTNGQNSVTSHVFIKTNTNPAGCVSSVGAFGRDITVVTSTGETVPISDSTGIWAGVCYGNQVVQPTSAPIQTAVPIVVQPVQVISSGVAVIPFMAAVAALLALVF